MPGLAQVAALVCLTASCMSCAFQTSCGSWTARRYSTQGAGAHSPSADPRPGGSGEGSGGSQGAGPSADPQPGGSGEGRGGTPGAGAHLPSPDPRPGSSGEGGIGEGKGDEEVTPLRPRVVPSCLRFDAGLIRG